MQFLLAVLAFSCVTLGFLFAERIYRSPTKPAWLDREIVAMPVCVGFTGAFAASFGAVLAAAFSLPLPIWGDVTSAVLVVAASGFAVRHLFRIVAPRHMAPRHPEGA